MQMLFVADPLEDFKIFKDSTFVMMRECEARGHALLACEPQDHSLCNLRVSRRCIIGL